MNKAILIALAIVLSGVVACGDKGAAGTKSTASPARPAAGDTTAIARPQAGKPPDRRKGADDSDLLQNIK
jgi:hypothetical protein